MNILTCYKEFLRELSIPMQILVSNKKLNIDEFLEKYYNLKLSDSRFQRLYGEYITDMREKLQKENIYTTTYYIILSLDDKSDINDVDNCLVKLEKTGVKIKRINDKCEYKRLLFQCINKGG